jgi:hypothetical protein
MPVLETIVMDPPFGLDVAARGWDKKEAALNGEKLKGLLAQFNAVNNSKNAFLATYYNMMFHREIVDQLHDSNFKAVTQLVIYKSGQNAVGTNNYVHAIDNMLIAQSPNREAGVWGLSANPLYRHNLLVAPRLTSHLTNAEGDSVNEHEKHPAVAKCLLESHSRPGSTVLVCFGGAGGEMIGAVYAKRNVIVFESDPVQFSALCNRLTALDALEELPPIVDCQQPRHFINSETFGPGIEHKERSYSTRALPLVEEVPAQLAIAAPVAPPAPDVAPALALIAAPADEPALDVVN